jgi:hypothetical protein
MALVIVIEFFGEFADVRYCAVAKEERSRQIEAEKARGTEYGIEYAFPFYSVFKYEFYIFEILSHWRVSVA